MILHLVYLYIQSTLQYSDFAKELANRDPIGKLTADKIEAEIAPIVSAENVLKGNNYSAVQNQIKISKSQKVLMNEPIIPTVEERMFMMNNYPVVMPYLVRPEQMLLLMMH